MIPGFMESNGIFSCEEAHREGGLEFMYWKCTFNKPFGPFVKGDKVESLGFNFTKGTMKYEKENGLYHDEPVRFTLMSLE